MGKACPLLEKEFGNKLEATMVGFPVIHGKLPTPFDMYEQAKMMGKGNEMKAVLFRTIHKDKVTGVLDRSLRESLIKEVGLDPKAFEEGMASGKPAKAFEEGRKWGERIKVQQTPTVLIDGNIKAETIDPENLKLIIQSILDADKKKVTGDRSGARRAGHARTVGSIRGGDCTIFAQAYVPVSRFAHPSRLTPHVLRRCDGDRSNLRNDG